MYKIFELFVLTSTSVFGNFMSKIDRASKVEESLGALESVEF